MQNELFSELEGHFAKQLNLVQEVKFAMEMFRLICKRDRWMRKTFFLVLNAIPFFMNDELTLEEYLKEQRDFTIEGQFFLKDWLLNFVILLTSKEGAKIKLII